MNKRIILLTDYKGAFYSSVVREDASMDCDALVTCFGDQGYQLDCMSFSEIDFRVQDYKGQVVLYQSSEDPDLRYKSYIEDMLLGLVEQGAVLVPPFRCFRAHHNKVFMEILRDVSANPDAQSVRAKGYGTREEFLADGHCPPGPWVIKKSAGAGGQDVRLASTKAEAEQTLRTLARSPLPFMEKLKDMVRALARKTSKSYARTHVVHSPHREKFVLQSYLPGLSHDYKVLAFGRKYYVVARRNRPGDFRASGSGLIEWPLEPPDGLLDYAESMFERFDVPCISLDVAFDGERFHLLEFQFLMFGTLTLERSTFFFSRQDGSWSRVPETPDLEREFADSVVRYLERVSQ